MRNNTDQEMELTFRIRENMILLRKQMEALPSSSGETVTQINNQIVSDPMFLKYNKANYTTPIGVQRPATPPLDLSPLFGDY